MASTLVPALVLGAMLVAAVPVQGQTAGAVVKPMTSAEKRDDFLDNKLAPRVAQDFAGALASVDQFLDANPNLDNWDKVRLVSRAGYLLYFSTPEAKRTTVAAASLQFLDDKIQTIKTRDSGDPGWESWEIRELLDNKVKILLAEKRAPEAVKVLEQWQTLPPSFDSAMGDSFRWGENWRAAQNQQGQPGQAVSGLIKALADGLLRRPTFAQGFTTNIVADLLAQGKTQEALSWAKLEFLLCPFNEEAIRDATRDVTRSLSAGELSLAKVNLFAAAQTDAGAPNPLDKVKLPHFDTTAIRAQLADPNDKSPFEVRLIALLSVGDYRSAMLLAKSQLIGDVTNQDTALQVARVFKAKDGNLVRANQFLAYYQLGQGDNPIPAFLKETETATAAAG